eukprot:6989436-Alexandrium_andersonii.AAC.1
MKAVLPSRGRLGELLAALPPESQKHRCVCALGSPHSPFLEGVGGCGTNERHAIHLSPSHESADDHL